MPQLGSASWTLGKAALILRRLPMRLYPAKITTIVEAVNKTLVDSGDLEVSDRDEFKCEGMLQINLLIDKSGVIHPILGLLQDLPVVTGLPSDALFPPELKFDKNPADDPF